MSEAEAKAPKEAKPVVASAHVIAALKRYTEGKATPEDKDLLLDTPEPVKRAARKAAGIKSRRGGFRTNVDMYVKRVGEDSARKMPKSDWKAFGELKKEVTEKGQKITIALIPHGASLK